MATKQICPWAGKLVRNVRLMHPAELAREGWAADQDVAALEFTDGSLIYAACDPEGNGPGALFGVTAKGRTCWISPAKKGNREEA